MTKSRKQRYGTGEVRIIGGAWRRRLVQFPAQLEIRPTPDRLRETLFNWLGDWIVGRRVLDLFAGSGALGIEALSRGAAETLFVERDGRSVDALRANLQALNAGNATVSHADVLSWLAHCTAHFDMVFIDPPYASCTAPEILSKLRHADCLALGHRVYLEQSAKRLADLPSDWELLREGRAGDAHGLLLSLSLEVTDK